MANRNEDVIRVEALAAALQSTLIPGQLGFATDTNQLGHLRKDGITMDWWDSNESSWLIWDATGHGGITTTSPQAKLDIYTNEDVKLALSDPSNSDNNHILTEYIAGGVTKFTTGYYNIATYQDFFAIRNASYIGFCMMADGACGIATTVPGYKWHINGDCGIEDNLYLNNLTPGSITFLGVGTGNYKAISEDNSNFFWDETTGRMGIGTNSGLTEKINVEGNIRLGGTGNIIMTGKPQIGGLTASKIVGTDGSKWLTSIATSGVITQTYSNVATTHNNLTSSTLTDSSGGTPDNTVSLVTDQTETTDNSVINDNFAELTEEVNALRVDLVNTKQILNTVIDILQNIAIIG